MPDTELKEILKLYPKPWQYNRENLGDSKLCEYRVRDKNGFLIPVEELHRYIQILEQYLAPPF